MSMIHAESLGSTTNLFGGSMTSMSYYSPHKASNPLHKHLLQPETCTRG
jgi:hypothetical protein